MPGRQKQPRSSPSTRRRFFSAISAVSAVILVVLIVAAGGAWWLAHRQPPVRFGSCSKCNLLLITIDTLRADRVGAYGGGSLTPTLDRLAAGGVRFANAHAHAPLTLPAHTSIMTGLVPATHGVHDNGAAPLDAQHPTMAGLLRGAGYRTGAFVGAFVLDARFGLNRGFDVYDDKVGSGSGPVNFAFAERPADRVAKIAGDWIVDAAAPARPWFSWVHLFDPHAPYRAPEQHAANPYDNEVAFVDEQIGRLLDRLREARQLDRTLIVVLADHGESLGEHGEATHGLFAYDATLRIPLIVAGPPIHPGVSTAAVAQADVLPTVLDLLGIAAPQTDGHSMRGALAGGSVPSQPLYFEALDAYLTRNWAPLTGVIEDGWKYIHLPEPELYDLANDPGELHNLAGREPNRAAALERRLGNWKSPAAALAQPASTSIDPDAAARLRALGYASGQAPRQPGQTYGVRDDPKRLIEVDRQYERALTLTGDRQYGEAEALLRSVIQQRPDFLLAYTNLASVLVEAGHPEAAIRLLEDAQQRGVAAPAIRERLGAVYLAAGDPRRAVATLNPIASRPEASLDARNSLAVALAELGERDRARRLFAEVLERSPASATTWNNLGLLEMADRRPAEAARAFEHAVAADPTLGAAWQALGAVRASSDTEAALAAWRRALALMPRNYNLLFNVAVLLRQQGHTDEARSAADRFVREAPPAQYASDIATLRAWLSK